MARNKGGFVFASNFEVKLKEALDPRIVVSAKADLINKETWPYDGDTVYLYNGLIVSAGSDGVYRLIDVNKVLNADFSGWERIDSASVEKLGIADNLESDSSLEALSARQGKILMNEINTVAGKLVGVYTFRGSKETFAELPEEGMNAGDVWNVNEKVGNHSAGTNWAWTGEAWDALAGSIDLSAYSTTSEVEALLKVETDRAIAREEELQLAIDANAGEISKANGEISKQALQIEGITGNIGEINDLNIEQNTKIATLESLIFGDVEEKPAETILKLIENNAGEIVTLKEDTEGLKKSINILNSGSDVEGSVDNKISQAFEWINIEV
jgi:hypothetical protein